MFSFWETSLPGLSEQATHLSVMKEVISPATSSLPCEVGRLTVGSNLALEGGGLGTSQSHSVEEARNRHEQKVRR